MARVLRADHVDNDLLEIGRFIAERSGSIDTALRFLDQIDEKCSQYAGQPEMGDARPDLGRNIRLFPVGNYVVIYQPLADGIIVLMVTRGNRNIPRVFAQRQRGLSS